MPIAHEVWQVMVLVLAKEKHLKLSGSTFLKKSFTLIFFTKALVITEEIRTSPYFLALINRLYLALHRSTKAFSKLGACKVFIVEVREGRIFFF